MNRVIKLILITTGIFFFSTLAVDILAQCPMCKIAAESNLKDGGTAARGLNNGILFILCLPYAIVFILGLLWYKNRKLANEQDSYVHN